MEIHHLCWWGQNDVAPLRNGELAISWKIRSARKRLTPLFQFRIQVIYLRTLGKLLAVVFNTCNCYLILKCGYILKKKLNRSECLYWVLFIIIKQIFRLLGISVDWQAAYHCQPGLFAFPSLRPVVNRMQIPKRRPLFDPAWIRPNIFTNIFCEITFYPASDSYLQS